MFCANVVVIVIDDLHTWKLELWSNIQNKTKQNQIEWNRQKCQCFLIIQSRKKRKKFNLMMSFFFLFFSLYL